ncbi:sortase (surface protein transpeptidase) [Streptomyces ambofaciens]
MASTTDTDQQEHAGEDGPPESGAGRRGRGPRRIVALAVSVFGELLITAGLVMGLFVVYSLWWTNVVADRAADQQAEKVRENWAQDRVGGNGANGPGALDTRAGIGFLHVPAMDEGDILVEKGTSMKVLNDGVAGYYTDPVEATLPTSDKKGNFSLAAHRDGHGAKFHKIDKIEKGRPDRLRDEGHLVRLQDVRRPARDLEVQRRGARRHPQGVRQEEGRPLHHPDDLHPGLHEPLPVRGLGRAGPHGEGGRRPHPAEGTALTSTAPAPTTEPRSLR